MKTTTIYQHIIEYWFDDDELELCETDIEHIQKSIAEGYNQGELNQLKDDNEIRGWWNIKRVA